MSQSGGGGTAKVPISGTPEFAGQTNYNNQTCNQYNVVLTSTNGANQSVTLSVTSGCYVSPTSTTVTPTGNAVVVYVPTSNTGSVVLTVSETGFTSNTVTVR